MTAAAVDDFERRCDSARSRGTARIGALAAALTVALVSGGCKQKTKPAPPPPPHLAGLAAIPADVRVVLGVDIAALAKSWLVHRAIDQMLLRDPALEGRLERLLHECKIDPATDLDGFVVGLGGPGSQEAAMVVSGALSESEIVDCVRARMRDGGGRLASTPDDRGRTLHAAVPGDDKGQTVWFTFSGPRSLVVATSQEWLSRAVGDGAKADDNKDIKQLLSRVDRSRGLWAVGMVDAAVGAGMVEITGGKVASPPRAMFLSLELGAGLEGELGAVMNSEQDANELKSILEAQVGLGALVLQRVQLGPIVRKLAVSAKGADVRVQVRLTRDELKDLLSRIDRARPAAQDPASGEVIEREPRADE